MKGFGLRPMRNPVPLLLLPFALLVAPLAFAQQQSFHVDPGASTVDFSLGDVLHSVHGSFHVQSGLIQFDSGTTYLSGAVVVAAGSGDSGNKTRDRKMTGTILDAPQFPVAEFAPHSYQGRIVAAGDSAIEIRGTFTLHGTVDEITIPVALHAGAAHCVVKAQFAIPYVEWGLKDPSTFLLRVSKEVKIDLMLSGRLAPST